jgi:hypothetical protein
MLSSGQRAKHQLEAGAARGLSIGSAPGETQRWNKHVVIHVYFAEDVGSTPTASTIPHMTPALLVMVGRVKNYPEEHPDGLVRTGVAAEICVDFVVCLHQTLKPYDERAGVSSSCSLCKPNPVCTGAGGVFGPGGNHQELQRLRADRCRTPPERRHPCRAWFADEFPERNFRSDLF